MHYDPLLPQYTCTASTCSTVDEAGVQFTCALHAVGELSVSATVGIITSSATEAMRVANRPMSQRLLSEDAGWPRMTPKMPAVRHSRRLTIQRGRASGGLVYLVHSDALISKLLSEWRWS